MKFSIADLAKNLSQEMKSKSSNRLIRRGGTFEPGTYDVTIAAVDTETISNGYFTLTLEAAHQEQHKQVIWLANFGGDGLSDGMEALLYGLFAEDKEALMAFLQFLGDESHVKHAFQMLRGMKFKITIGDTEGFVIVNKGGKYFAVNNKTDAELVGPLTRRILVKRAAIANGHKEPKSIILDAEATHEDDNVKALYNSVEAITNAEAGGDNRPTRLEAVK